MRTVFLLLLLLGWNGFRLAAADTPAVTVRCFSPAEGAAKWINPSICLFGDQPITFDAEVTAPLGSRLAVYADLYQTSAGGWSVALSKNLRLSPVLQFDARTQLIAPCALPNLPAVRGPTRMLLKLSVRAQGTPDSARPMGTVDLLVFPRQKPGEWKDLFATTLARHGLARLALFGKEEALRRFFRRQQISFDDLGADWPEALDPHILYLGDFPPAKPDQSPSLTGAHIALFLPNSAGSRALPGVYSATDPAGGAVVKVTLSDVLDRLNDDPRSQQTLLEIVGQALNAQVPLPDANPMPPSIP